MKILYTSLLILMVISGQLYAEEHSAANNKITLKLDDSLEVSVKGNIAPIGGVVSNNFKDWDSLTNLRVAEPEKKHSASVFESFLPNKPVAIGELWIVNKTGVLTLLKQLHPNPSLFLHINAGDSLGLWACLRAYNDRYADIVFRIHAEFVLKDGWFTPSQFTGHLVVDRIHEKVAFFEMYVPEGTVNFDVNRRSHGMRIAGAGYCSQMELRTGAKDFLKDIKFSESITQKAAERALILRFYRSQQINWVSPDQVLEMSKAQQKPIHAISIDGPLIDESC